MPEFIDLLSSPVKSPVGNSAALIRKLSTPQLDSEDNFNLGSDDFKISDLSDDLGLFPVAQASKKRRLSPEIAEKTLPPCDAGREKPVCLLSDEPDLPPLDDCTRTAPYAGATTYEWDNLVSDPIVFTSSAPERGKAGRTTTKFTVLDLSDHLPSDLFGDEIPFSLSQPTTTSTGRVQLSERTTNLLASISNKDTKNFSKSDRYKSTETTRKSALSQPDSAKIGGATAILDEIFKSSPPLKQRATTSVKVTKAPNAVKRGQPEDRAASKAAKEAEKELKRIAREQKAKEKQDAAGRAEANKSKTDKKVTAPEMIIDLSMAIEGSSLCDQILENMKQLGVETTFFDEANLGAEQSGTALPSGNIVRWRRKVTAKYNSDAGYWEPLAVQIIEDETHVLVHLTAIDFAEITTSCLPGGDRSSLMTEEAMTRSLDMHVAALRKKCGLCKPIYLVEGLVAWLRKNKNAKNRAYTAAVRSQVPVEGPSVLSSSSQARRKTKANPSMDVSFIDDEVVEGLLLHLQIRHDVLIHHTTSPTTSAEWIKNFTEHMSTIPYRQERMVLNDGGAAFCMDVGQVKTGDDAQDTYVKMLQEIQRVTPAMAYGISNQHRNVQSLVDAFRKDGALVLEEVRKSANKDGMMTNSRLGQAVSKRLYKVFMGMDPWSTNGIS